MASLFLLAKVYFIVFALATMAGGVMGYVKARSLPSLIAGGIAGVLLLIGALLIGRVTTTSTGLVIDLIVSLALLGRFAPALFRRKPNPAAYIVPPGVIGAALALVLLFSPGAHP